MILWLITIKQWRGSIQKIISLSQCRWFCIHSASNLQDSFSVLLHHIASQPQHKNSCLLKHLIHSSSPLSSARSPFVYCMFLTKAASIRTTSHNRLTFNSTRTRPVHHTNSISATTLFLTLGLCSAIIYFSSSSSSFYILYQ